MSARRPEFFFVLCRLTQSLCSGQMVYKDVVCMQRPAENMRLKDPSFTGASSHCLEIQIFAAAQSQLCQLFYNRMFVCVNSSSESIIVFLLLPRSQQKFLPRFHSAVLLSLSCRLVAGCCGKLFRKTPLAPTMHQPHFSVCSFFPSSSSSPLH